MKLSDTQLVLLSAASQREDGGVEIGPSLKGSASRKVLGKLLTEHLIEEIPAQGSLPVWRRDEDKGPVALRCPGAGLSGRNCVRYLGLRDGFLSDQLPCMLMIGVYDSSYRWPQGSPCESGQMNRLVHRFI